MVLDIEPVAHVLALAIDRQGLAFERVEDRQRDELFGEMIGPVIVRAVREHDRQAIGVVPGAHEMIGGRLRGRIGRVRLVGRGLGKGAVGPERAEDLVGRDVMKAESVARRAAQ